MIIYARSLAESQKSTSLKLNDFRKQLNFLPFVEQNREQILALLRTAEGRQLLSNLTAALVRQLVYRHQILPSQRTTEYDPSDPPLVDTLSQLFDQKTQSLGFVQTVNAKRWRQGHPGRAFIVVLGCQTPALLDRRVRAAARLVRTAELVDAVVVFSGANPTYAAPVSASDRAGTRASDPAESRSVDASEARIIDESAHMCSLFEAELGHSDIERLNLSLHTEAASGKTSENIHRSMTVRGIPLEEFRHLVLISSSFHLPRISSVALEAAASRGASFETVSLVGSELPFTNGSKIRWDINYLRSAVYEAMRIILDESEPEVLVKRDSH